MLVWYAAIAPALSRTAGAFLVLVLIFAGESYGQYPEGIFVIIGVLMMLYTDVVSVMLRESGARSLALYSVGVVVLYVGTLTFGQYLLGNTILQLPVLLWVSELCVGVAVVQAFARPSRILHARQERYAKVEEIFRL